MFARLSIGWKLQIAFALVALLGLCNGGVAYWGVGRLAESLNEIAAVRVPALQSLQSLDAARAGVQGPERVALLVRDPKEVERQIGYINVAWENADKAYKAYEALHHSGEESRLWGEFTPAWKTWRQDHEKVMRLAAEARAAKGADQERLEKEAQTLTFGAARESHVKVRTLLVW